MKKQQTLTNSTLQKKKKQSLFLKIFCPCLCSKEDKQQKIDENIKRHEFYEQQSQKQQHQETQANLPVNYLSEFNNNIKNNKNYYKNQKTSIPHLKSNHSSNQVIIKLIRQEYSISPASKHINFKVKRTNNLEGYLSKNEPNDIQNNKNSKKQVDRSQLDKKYINMNKQRFYESTKHTSNRQNSQQLNDKNLKIRQNSKQDINSLKNVNKQNTNFNKNNQVIIKNSKQKRLLQKIYNKTPNINRQQLLSIQKKLQKMDQLGDYQFLKNWQQSYQNHFPINQYKQNKLMIIGNKDGKMLTKITNVNLFHHPTAIERYKDSIKNKKLNKNNNKPQHNFNSDIDKYWDKRYFLFEKFDEGIQLDEQSWYSVTPQTVADYISAKINVKQTILDAFCGAGGDSIKLATSCKKVISNDIDPTKIKCLINNAKIYDVNNIDVSCDDFFNLDCRVDAVYLAPPWGGPDYYKIQSFDPQQFQPKLSRIFQKAFQLSHNVFFLLPANTQINSLASIISQKIQAQFSSTKSKFISQSCSLKLQKIYYNERLKFILGFYGNSQIQNDIKLTDQLGYIYQMLKQGSEAGNQGIFKHKKLIRKIREQYGMVNLLKYVFGCQNYTTNSASNIKNGGIQNVSMIQKFENYLLQNNLISKVSLQKIKQQQNLQYQYELKNRQNKNRKQKNKKIQKHKEKQEKMISINQRQQSQNLTNKEPKQISSISTKYTLNEPIQRVKKVNNFIIKNQPQNEEELQQQIQQLKQEYSEDIPIQSIIHKQNKHNKQGLSSFRNQLKQTISSQNSELTLTLNNEQLYNSKYTQEYTHSQNNRQSLRTVSYISEFQQDQLHNINAKQRMRTNSDVSIVDSIYPIQKFDSLQASIDTNLNQFSQNDKYKNRFYQDQYNLKMSQGQNQPKGTSNKAQMFGSHRQSAPVYLSPRENVKMTKHKKGHIYEKATLYEVNQQRQ